MFSIARLLILLGVTLILLGGGALLLAKLDLPFGRLPGDIQIERGNLTCVIALGTSLLLSLLLTLVLNLLTRFLNK